MTDIDFREIPEGCGLDEIHFDLWAGLMEFLLKKDEVRAQFERETGMPKLVVPRSPIERMIDQACGVSTEDYMRKFILWATPNYFGEESDISPSIQKKLDGARS